uniref:Solute carrier family 38 member 5a n=1 Tax=Anabas testudineus TaxID=64144 RepID=A0A7N6A398_ANATE
MLHLSETFIGLCSNVKLPFLFTYFIKVNFQRVQSSNNRPSKSLKSQFEGKTSFGMSVFNLSNAIMGSGILGLAFAMSNTGIILFITLLVFIAIVSAYSIHLLLRSAGVVGIRAYEQLGMRAFGPPGKLLAACVITVHNIGGYLGYTSGFSLTCMVFFLISVIYKKFNISCPLDDPHHNITPIVDMHTVENGTFCEAKLFTMNSQTAYTIPILAFAFVCHPEVLPIYTELRNATKKRMQNVANISILAMFIMYLLTALFGYLTFFGAVESELLHTYSRVDPLDVLILCVRLAVLVAVTLTVPVVLFPIRRALLQIFFPDQPFHWARHVIIAFSLIFVVNLLVIFVPTIRDIFGLIGATSAPSLIFILPGIFYVRIVPKEQEPLLSRPKIQAACFAALGFLFMVMSLSFIITDWVTGESRSGGGH